MQDWWSSIGEASVSLGSGLGFVWAAISTSNRRRKHAKAAIAPFGQLRWFLLNLLGMGCFITLSTALGLASLHELIPQGLFWFLLGLSVVAFASALLFSSVETPLPAAFERESFESPATPPVLPVSKSA